MNYVRKPSQDDQTGRFAIEPENFKKSRESTAVIRITLSPLGTAQGLMKAAIFLTGLSTAVHVLQFVYGREFLFEIGRFVNLGDEKNLPTWFAALLFMSAAFLLAYIGRSRHTHKNQEGRAWVNMAFIFALLSLDEIATVHDRLIEQMLIDWLHPGGFLAFPWVIVGWVAVIAFGLGFRNFIRQLPRRTKLLFLTAGAIFVTGALLFEMGSAYLIDVHPSYVIIRGVVATVQEFSEMFGLILFIYALLDYIRSHLPKMPLPSS